MDKHRHSTFPSLPRQQIALVLALLITFNVACADEVQVGRYATMRAVPTPEQVICYPPWSGFSFPHRWSAWAGRWSTCCSRVVIDLHLRVRQILFEELF